jgi:two-component system response regulator PhoP
MRILVVEDDPVLLAELARTLRSNRFVVDTADNGEDGVHLACEYPIDLAIVDLGLPGRSGLDVIRHARAGGRQFPILILTARTRWQEKVEGLEAGADDYMVKPFEMPELLARLRALLRRSGGWSQAVLRCGPIALDPARHTVTVDHRPVSLTAYEYKVLQYLMHRAGEVVSKSTLTEHIYEEEEDRDSNVIEVFIRRLRVKLDPDNTLKPIETVRGSGYRFTLPRVSEDANAQ